jgi:hypothetical protein
MRFRAGAPEVSSTDPHQDDHTSAIARHHRHLSPSLFHSRVRQQPSTPRCCCWWVAMTHELAKEVPKVSTVPQADVPREFAARHLSWNVLTT